MLMPMADYTYERIQPLNDNEIIQRHMDALYNLTELAEASKILLGAQYRSNGGFHEFIALLQSQFSFSFKGAVSTIFSVHLNSRKRYLYGRKRKRNGSVLLTTTLRVHRNWFHSSLTADGQDGNGLQIEKNGHFCQVPPVYFGKTAKKNNYSLFLSCFDQHTAKVPWQCLFK